MQEERIDPRDRSDSSDITRREVLTTLGLLGASVAAGAAGADLGRITYSDTFGGVRISAVHFGV